MLSDLETDVLVPSLRVEHQRGLSRMTVVQKKC